MSKVFSRIHIQIYIGTEWQFPSLVLGVACLHLNGSVDILFGHNPHWLIFMSTANIYHDWNPEPPAHYYAASRDDVIKWKHFPHYWPFVRGIHRSPVNSPHKSQWRGALMFYLICAWIHAWVNNGEAGDLRRHRAHYDVVVMWRDGCIFDVNSDRLLS